MPARLRQSSFAGITNINNGVTARGYDFEFYVELTGVTGLSELFVRPVSGGTDTPYFSNGAGGVVADLWPDNTTENLFVYSTVPETFAPGTTYTGPSIFFGFTADRPPAGTIDISRISFQRVTAD